MGKEGVGSFHDLVSIHSATSGRNDFLCLLRPARGVFKLLKNSLSAFFSAAVVAEKGACLRAVIENAAVFTQGVLVGECERCWEIWAIISLVPMLGTYATDSPTCVLGEFAEVVSIARIADNGKAQILDDAYEELLS